MSFLVPPAGLWTSTQTNKASSPIVVCAVGAPTPTPAANVVLSPGSDPELQAPTDDAQIYTLSHNGTNVRELQREDADIGQTLSWLEKGQRPPWQRLKGESRGLRILWHEFPRLTFVDGLLSCVAVGCRIVYAGCCASCLGPRGHETSARSPVDYSPGL